MPWIKTLETSKGPSLSFLRGGDRNGFLCAKPDDSTLPNMVALGRPVTYGIVSSTVLHYGRVSLLGTR